MQFYTDGDLIKAYVISTSKRPPNTIEGSLGTPPGLHSIAKKIGDGQPPGIVFKGRVATGFHFNEVMDRTGDETSNLITTRILWLKGLEAAKNQGPGVDSYDRYIYIHGTNHEDQLGERQSAGCVLMGNLDILELYDKVRVGDPVLIDL